MPCVDGARVGVLHRGMGPRGPFFGKDRGRFLRGGEKARRYKGFGHARDVPVHERRSLPPHSPMNRARAIDMRAPLCLIGASTRLIRAPIPWVGRIHHAHTRASLARCCTNKRYACTSLPSSVHLRGSFVHPSHGLGASITLVPARVSLARARASDMHAPLCPHRCIYEAHSCTHPMGWAHPSRSYPRESRSVLHQQARFVHLSALIDAPLTQRGAPIAWDGCASKADACTNERERCMHETT
jgi:hypothetical protein